MTSILNLRTYQTKYIKLMQKYLNFNYLWYIAITPKLYTSINWYRNFSFSWLNRNGFGMVLTPLLVTLLSFPYLLCVAIFDTIFIVSTRKKDISFHCWMIFLSTIKNGLRCKGMCCGPVDSNWLWYSRELLQ